MSFQLLDLIGDYNVGAGEVFIVVLRSAIFLGTDLTLIPKASQYGNDANEICGYLRQLRHPIFGLNAEITKKDPTFNVYPSVVSATTSLTGKELAYSLNFPQKSVSGLPVLECAEFGRNVVTYDSEKQVQTKRLTDSHEPAE